MRGMRVMNMPGFTAEVSLNRTSAQYRMTAGKLVGTEASIFPQLRIVATGPGKKTVSVRASVTWLTKRTKKALTRETPPASNRRGEI